MLAGTIEEQILQLHGGIHGHEPQEQHLELDALLGAAPEAPGGLEVRHRHEQPQQVHLLEAPGHGEEPGPRVARDLHVGLGIHPQREEHAQPVRESVHELHRVVAGVQELLDVGEHGGPIALRHPLEESQVSVLVHQSEHAADVRSVDPVAREGEHLVEQGQRVPHPALGPAGDRQQRALAGVDPLPLEDRLEASEDVLDGDPPEVEALAPRQHGGRRLLDALRLGGREGEDHPRGRLLEDLEERVPRLPGEHVRLVDDVDLVAPLLRGSVHGPLAQIPRVVDPAVAGGVDLHHVQRRASGPDALARLARAARLAPLPVRTVEGHGEDAGRRGLADPPRAAEQVGVAHAAALDGRAQGAGDRVLADEFVEASGTVRTGECGARQRSSRSRR